MHSSMTTAAQAILRFEAAGQSYGFEIADVVEIVPAVPLRVIPGSPAEVVGVLRYRENMVPVLDVTRLLTGRAAEGRFSTRTAIVRYQSLRGQSHLLGLLVENASQTITEDLGDLKPSGISSPAAPYLGELATYLGSTLQIIHVQQLIPEPLHELLFAE